MTRAEDSGAEHDAYLRSALRHAPDAALAPPDALDDAILRRARSATAEAGAELKPHAPLPREASRRHRSLDPSSGVDRILSGLAGAWSWLARPAVASGFAVVMVATLVGVMWWGRPLDEAMSRRFEPPTPRAPAASAQDPGAVAMRSEPSKTDARPSPAEANGTAANAAEMRGEAAAVAKQRSNADALDRSTQSAARDVAEPASPPATTQPAPALLAKRRAAPAAFPEQPSEPAVDAGTPERQAGSERGSGTALAVPKTQASAPVPEPAVPPSLTSEPRAVNRFQSTEPRPDSPSAARQTARALGAAAPTAQERPTSSAASESTAAPAVRDAPDRLGAAPARTAITAAAPLPALADRNTASSHPAAEADAARTPEQASAAEALRSERADAARAGALSSSRVTPVTRSVLGPLRAALVSEPGRWTWSADGRRVQRVTPALLAWLARLDAALAAQSLDTKRPEPAPESDDPAPAASAPTGPLHTLVLLRENRRHTELRLGEALEVTPIDPPGPRWRAALSAADAATLREGLP